MPEIVCGLRGVCAEQQKKTLTHAPKTIICKAKRICVRLFAYEEGHKSVCIVTLFMDIGRATQNLRRHRMAF